MGNAIGPKRCRRRKYALRIPPDTFARVIADEGHVTKMVASKVQQSVALLNAAGIDDSVQLWLRRRNLGNVEAIKRSVALLEVSLSVLHPHGDNHLFDHQHHDDPKTTPDSRPRQPKEAQKPTIEHTVAHAWVPAVAPYCESGYGHGFSTLSSTDNVSFALE
jgi:hypothetical protein